MNWWIVFLKILFASYLVAGVWLSVKILWNTIQDKELQLYEQAEGYLAQASWRQCNECRVYERSCNVTCHRHPFPGTLTVLELRRALRVRHVLNHYTLHYSLGGVAASYHRDSIGAYYLWLQDVSHRQEWDEAVWILLNEERETQKNRYTPS